MKSIKKKPAIAIIVVLSIILVVGAVFAFIPMQWGHTTYKSFAGAIRVGNDYGAGMYAEYDISKDGETDAVSIRKSISTIKEILSEQGKPSANVFSVNDEKIRVDISYENGGNGFRDAYTLLKAVGVGKFELRSDSQDEDTTFIDGSKHIKGITISNYTSYTYVTLQLNEAGIESFQEYLDGADKTIYVCMGGKSQTSFSSENITKASEELPLTFTSYASAVDFAMKVKLGCLPITLNSDTVSINTIEVKSTILPVIIALAVVIIASLAYFAIRFGIMGALNAVSTLATAIAASLLLWAIPMVEINTSSLLAIFFGFAIMNIMKNNYAERIKNEYMSGKTIEASLDAGYKKSIATNVALLVAVLIPTIILSFVSTAMIQTCSIIVVMLSVLGGLESLLFMPFLVNLTETFNRGNDKIYRFKREEV